MTTDTPGVSPSMEGITVGGVALLQISREN
nr:MAG TPA: hypothetical protein [Caudoviricetes sp.]